MGARRLPLAAGLDIGGTKTLAVAVDRRGAIVARARVPTVASDGDAVAASSLDALARLAREAGRSLASFEVIGAGVPGWVRAGAGTVSHAVNLGVGPEPVALATRLTAATGVPAFVENDVNAAAFGAATLLGADDLAYLSVGTGLAAGLILGGALRRGADGVVGEIGHLPVVAGGPICECGQQGCLETVASGTAIARRWPGPRAAATLVAAAGRGEPEAVAALDDLGDHLATAVLLLVMTVDPRVVVLGGGVAEVGAPLLRSVRAGLARQAERSALLASLDLGQRVRLVPGGEPVGALGAALLAGQRWGEERDAGLAAGVGT